MICCYALCKAPVCSVWVYWTMTCMRTDEFDLGLIWQRNTVLDSCQKKKGVVFSSIWETTQVFSSLYVRWIQLHIHALLIELSSLSNLFFRWRRGLHYMPFEWGTQKGRYWPPWPSWLSRNPWPAWKERRTWWSRTTWSSWLPWCKSEIVVSLLLGFICLLWKKPQNPKLFSMEKWLKIFSFFLFFFLSRTVEMQILVLTS